MQRCAVRSCGLFGLARVSEVRRRADHDHAHLGSDRNGDHVLRDLLPKANTCIVPLGNDVGQAVIHDNLDDNIGISGQEALQGGPESRQRRAGLL